MDTIVNIALVGTARQNNFDTTTGTSVDILTEQLAEGEAERKLLLKAGALAIYRQAGKLAEMLPTIPESASEEHLPVSSKETISIVESMLKGDHGNLLSETLERLAQIGWRLPYELLPTALALGTQTKDIRAALFPILGERGKWLSHFNTAWSWVSEFLPGAQDILPPDAETIWQEGTLGQRCTVLRLLRAIDATKARDWLIAVWKQEKAEARTELVKTFEVGLSTEDEGFLEKALDDRAVGVRLAIPPLLARIPNSAFAIRMRIRADMILSYSGQKITVTPPTAIDKQWERDGIVAKPPSSAMGERAWWMIQVLSYVAPAHWEERFGLPPEKLLTAVKSHEWYLSVIEGWSEAVRLHGSTAWMTPLWQWWCRPKLKDASFHTSIDEMRKVFGAYVPQAMVEQRVLDMNQGSSDWLEGLGELPTPWSQQFAENYLRGLRDHLASLDLKLGTYPHSDPWYQSLSIANRALPATCLPILLEKPIMLPDKFEETHEKMAWQARYWIQEVQNFNEVLRIRQRLIEEIV